MAEEYQVPHRCVSVKVRKLTAVKNGVKYTGWEILDYSSGKRVRHQRAMLAEAKAKAKEVCECLATNKREVLAWDDQLRFSIQQALKLLKGTGATITRACSIFAEAVRFVATEETIAACL